MIDENKVQGALELDNFEATFFAREIGWFDSESPRHFVHVYRELALAHLYGLEGRKKSFKLTMRYLERGISLGSGDCANELSKLYKSDTWWWGKPKKQERDQEYEKWRKKAIELWAWEANNLNDTYAAYQIFHAYRPLRGQNNPDPFRDKLKAEKWRDKTIELSNASGDEYASFVLKYEKDGRT